MSGAERSKGARGELEVVKLVQAAGWRAAHRNFASGAAGFSDVAHGPAGVVIESKRTERLRFRDAWRQVEADAHRAGPGTLPLLATRWNSGSWLGVVELDELLTLLYLREHA
jgi:Holliday junction resolvase